MLFIAAVLATGQKILVVGEFFGVQLDQHLYFLRRQLVVFLLILLLILHFVFFLALLVFGARSLRLPSVTLHRIGHLSEYSVGSALVDTFVAGNVVELIGDARQNVSIECRVVLLAVPQASPFPVRHLLILAQLHAEETLANLGERNAALFTPFGEHQLVK